MSDCSTSTMKPKERRTCGTCKHVNDVRLGCMFAANDSSYYMRCARRTTMTNFERITESSEKLAGFLAWNVKCSTCPAEEICARNQGECEMSLLEWLKEESE